MGVLRGQRRWCLCAGGGKSERVKGTIFSTKGAALAAISAIAGGGGGGSGLLIHRNLLLTTHANLPSASAAESAEIRLDYGRLAARLEPHRFFITSSVLDLTIVGLEAVDSDSTHWQQPNHLKTCCNPSLDLGSTVYLLGHTHKKDLIVGEGKVVIATDNLIKLSTDGLTWFPGSAGFDVQGNLAFMVCDPMKLASSPTMKSSSTSSSSPLSWKRDPSTHFGIPISVIREWLHQHWEGSLDELSKPRLPLIRLLSTGQRSEHSCASFTLRHVFKPTEGENHDTSSLPQMLSRSRQQVRPGNNSASQEENRPENNSHDQGIPTPQIYESPKLTSGPIHKKENAHIQLLDINFPPRVPRSILLPPPLKQLLAESSQTNAEEPNTNKVNSEAGHGFIPVGSREGDCCSEVQSCSSPLEVSELPPNEDHGFSSGEETMYSAETMESRNIPSPKGNKFQNVGRSQSCVNYSRWSASPQRSSTVAKRGMQKQWSSGATRRTRSQATTVLPQRSHDYFSPTVSSAMKKRNSEQTARPRQNVVQVSSKWLS